ncbi:hypothetical protein BFW38_00485 [Terasakiispira papahanaumokuakeensis]|uniref:Diguanylate cyclase n=1 Tax=Terasakiispira papahanaumokuakeensis TaxID=197479 RepID=A0A1E2V5V6_9GAMM|nr:EAL domain-containing protein [Terasakiispira papahanaumokuakeensis]ODC02246.1 hypothetical protein BFW38_00485 [Terasakiispira papahanaumokuakeensis]
MAKKLYLLIGRQVTLGFIVLTFLLVVVVGAGMFGLLHQHHQAMTLREDYSFVRERLERLRVDVAMMRRYEKDILLHYSEPTTRDAYFGQWQRYYDNAYRGTRDLAELPQAPELLTRLTRTMLTHLERYSEGMSLLSGDLVAGRITSPKIGNQVVELYQSNLRELDTALLQTSSYLTSREAHFYEASYGLRNQMLVVIGGLGLLALLASLFVAFTVTRRARTIALQLDYQATHDDLTGLLNRRGFEREVASRSHFLDKASLVQALFYIDLDQFKLVNDVCGHTAGDELLQQLCQVMKEVLPEKAVLARIGGDEFALYVDLEQMEDIPWLAQRLLDAVQQYRFAWESRFFAVSASIGIIQLEEDGRLLRTSLGRADAACFMAKDRGRNQYVLLDEADLKSSEWQSQVDWAARITELIESDRLRLHFQRILPVANPGDRYNKCEVLLRALDDDGELIMPGVFIPAAERFSLMKNLDRWVVQAVLRNIQAGGELSRFRTISLNLSGDAMSDPEFCQFLEAQLEHSGVDGHRLCFEVTETVAINNFDHAIHLISALKQYHCRFALDDFGAGVSSFGYLKRLPVDVLKIDGAFIRNVNLDAVDQAMVRSVVDVANSLNLLTVAEFVDNPEVMAWLEANGVDYAQGFYLHKPEPVDGADA